MSLQRRLRLEWSEYQGRGCLNIRGWAGDELRQLEALPFVELSRHLKVLPTELLGSAGDTQALPPTAGDFHFGTEEVRFIPRFPFRDGLTYSLMIDGIQAGAIERPAAPAAPATVVTNIYPTAKEIPVNQLKIYVHFSNPMSEGWANRVVPVYRDDTGELLDGVFIPMDPELWDPARTRLTLLLDPARIKRGLVPNVEAGYPLIEGVPIRIAVEPAFMDATGQPLLAGEERRYRVGPPLRTRIDTSLWTMDVPRAGTQDPYRVTFDRPMDHALLQRCLSVVAHDGSPVAGKSVSGPGEANWAFHPSAPWQPGVHFLLVDPVLEDLAGNSPLRVFDRDITREDRVPFDGPIALEFSCA